VSVRLDLDLDMFEALGAFTDGTHTVISPWHGVDTSVSEAVRARLERTGAVEGTVASSTLRPTLAALAAATAITKLRFLGAGVLVEYMVWVSANHGPVGLAATATVGTLRLEDPAPTDQIVDYVTGLVGSSPLRGLDLTLDLPIDDGLVLATLIDLRRRRILSALAGDIAPTDEPVDVAEVRAALFAPPASGLSLAGAIQQMCGGHGDTAAAALSDSLVRLRRQGWVDPNSSTVGLAGPCAALAERFAAITSIVELANACCDGTDDVSRLGFTCLQAGVSDLMTIEWIEQGLHIETVSAETVVGYIEDFVRRPDFARVSAATPQSYEATPPDRPAATIPQQASSRPVAMTRGRVIAKQPWRATHLAPAGGLSAWATPDPAALPVARIDPRVELQLLERSGDWAHIVCNNGWSAWVDGHAINEIPPRMPPVPASGPAHIAAPPEAGAAAKPPWLPTHLVPDGGMSAWASPDPRGVPVARIDPRVELQLLERSGKWAHVVCKNGWSAWVDGRAIEELHPR
jgi:SH3-like domain-containing protein